MRGKLWLKHFAKVIGEEEEKWKSEGKDMWCGRPEWTKFMGDVMDGVGEKINCYVIRRREEKEHSGEYLNIDAFFIDKAEYALKHKWDPFVLPRAVVELENEGDPDIISSCLWKILCVRSPIRVLICYQPDADGVQTLSKHLEDVIWQGSLMRGEDGDLLVIIGNQTVKAELGDWEWREYFTIFEWRNDRLAKIEGLEW